MEDQDQDQDGLMTVAEWLFALYGVDSVNVAEESEKRAKQNRKAKGVVAN